MEQPRCWMWTRRRQGLTSTTTYDESWEEQAFAEDTAGTLGGCVWPPRSYTCSFCRREFRSAQALGGHMNVHRRDRARLKQQSPCNSHLSSIDDNTFQTQTQIQSPLFDSSFHDQYQQKNHHHHHHQVCSFVDNYNPNPNSAHHQQNHQASRPEKNLLRTLSSSPSNSSPKSCSSSDLGKETDHHHDHIIKKRCRTEREDDDNLSVSLNLFVRRARPASPVEGVDRVGCKRKRIENWALPSLLLKPIAVDRSPSSSNIDHGLDLELRLGGTA